MFVKVLGIYNREGNIDEVGRVMVVVISEAPSAQVKVGICIEQK